MVARLRGLALVAALGMAAVALWWLRTVVGTPVVGSWAAAERWYETVGPASAIVACVRVGAMALAGWLAMAAAVALLAAANPWSGAQAMVDLIAPRSLQRLVHGLAGLSLTAGLALPAPSAGILGSPSETAALMVRADPADGEGTATMHLVDAPTPDGPAPEGPVSKRVVVVPGDSFWSIAEEAVRDAGVAQPDDADVARYWRRVIEQNRTTLVDPATPDLIYAGQVFTLPARHPDDATAVARAVTLVPSAAPGMALANT